MEILHNLREELDDVSEKQLALFIILTGVALLFIGWLISLTNAWWWLQLALFATALAALIGGMYQYRQRHPKRSAPQLPPKPENPPIIQNSCEPQTEQLPEASADLSVQEQILVRLTEIATNSRTAVEQREQERIREQQLADTKERLMKDKTIHWNDRASLKRFYRRGLWRICIALSLTVAVVWVTAENIRPNQDSNWWLPSILAVMWLIWYTIRWWLDWWMYRYIIEGATLKIIQPAFGFFGWNGAPYRVSLFSCDNVRVQKTWFERLVWWWTATVDIDTARDNREKTDGSQREDADIFKNMRDMRHPNEFAELVTRLHNGLMLGLPNNARRAYD